METTKRVRSVRLTDEQKKLLRRLVAATDTKGEAAEWLGVARSTLDRICALGKGSASTAHRISRIPEYFQQKKA